jgi:hypothetical protein
MSLSRKRTATEFALRCLLLLALWATGTLALAAPVAGTVVQLSGPLMAKKANGTVKVLALKSEVENGDTLVTEKNTYAMVKFIDNSEITLRPDTTLTIENFSFDNGKQDEDRANFNLVKGGLRSVTGLLGKRSKEKFELKTPAATIGIRGTTFIAQYVPPPESNGMRINPNPSPLFDAPAGKVAAPQGKVVIDRSPDGGGAQPLPALAPGLHLSVTDGMIVVSNIGGARDIAAGQFGFVPGANQPPVLVPPNSGLQFAPPQSFSGVASGPQASSGGSSGERQGVDCIVR